MKYTFQWLLAVVCLFVVGNVSVMADDEEVKTVPIPISTGEVVTGDDMRGVIVVPFTAYYQGGIIYISTSAGFSVITIAVENETTGQTWDSTTDISDGMGEIHISGGGAGSYILTLVTAYGDKYYGTFTIQ